MKSRSLVVLMLLSTLTASACGGDDPKEAGGTNCEKYCAVAKTLNCADQDEAGCVPTCEQRYQAAVQAKPACKAQLDVAAACLAGRLAVDFQCNASGQAETKPQVCAIEVGNANTCIRT